MFGREEKDTGDFFLGGRRVPAVVASLSFVAAEISALTIVGFPANAYGENWEYVPFFLGGAVAASLSPFSSSPSTIDATDPDFDACDGDSSVLSLSGDWHAPLCLLPAAPPGRSARRGPRRCYHTSWPFPCRWD